MQRSGLRLLALLGLLVLPILLAIGSQAIAERPGPPEVPATDLVVEISHAPNGGDDDE